MPEYRRLIESSVCALSEVRNRGYRGNGSFSDAYRELIERYACDKFHVYYSPESENGRLLPAERSIQITLSWVCSPRPVRFGNIDNVGGADVVILSRFRNIDIPGFYCVGANDYAVLWMRDGLTIPSGENMANNSLAHPLKELVGVFIVGLFLIGVGMLLLPRVRNGHVCVTTYFCAIAVFSVAAFFSLSHTFVAPTGLGVFGGKAKLLYYCNGFPDGFFRDFSRSTLQPSYVPGLSLLTLVAYLFSKGAGEWMTQLIAVFPMLLLAVIMCIRSESFIVRVWVVTSLLTPLSLQLSSLYYAEPFVAMFMLLGWSRIRDGNGGGVSWFLIGVAGLFKNEGILLFVFCWFAIRTVFGNGLASLSGLFWGLLLPIVWQIGCRLIGGTLYDFASIWDPDAMQALSSMWYFIKIAIIHPWNYAGVCVALLLCSFVLRINQHFNRCEFNIDWIKVVVIVGILSMIVYAYVFSLSRADDFEWHLTTSAARLLWPPAMLIMFELVIQIEMLLVRESKR